MRRSKTHPSDQLLLDELAELLSQNSEDWQPFLDLDTGAILSIPLESLRQLEGDEPSLFADPDLVEAFQEPSLFADPDLVEAFQEPSLFADPDLVEAFQEQARRLHEDQTGRYASIEPLGGYQRFALMESFVGELAGGRLRRQLEQALRGRKPFRRFKDQLATDPAMRERWFAFERQALREHARRWLEDVRADRAPAN